MSRSGAISFCALIGIFGFAGSAGAQPGESRDFPPPPPPVVPDGGDGEYQPSESITSSSSGGDFPYSESFTFDGFGLTRDGLPPLVPNVMFDIKPDPGRADRCPVLVQVVDDLFPEELLQEASQARIKMHSKHPDRAGRVQAGQDPSLPKVRAGIGKVQGKDPGSPSLQPHARQLATSAIRSYWGEAQLQWLVESFQVVRRTSTSVVWSGSLTRDYAGCIATGTLAPISRSWKDRRFRKDTAHGTLKRPQDHLDVQMTGDSLILTLDVSHLNGGRIVAAGVENGQPLWRWNHNE
jgi:hypothetical protein